MGPLPLIRPSGTVFAFDRATGALNRFATGSKSRKGRREGEQTAGAGE